MSIEKLRKELEASGHRVVENHMTDDELEAVERELDETVGIDDERMTELVTRAKTALSTGKSG